MTGGQFMVVLIVAIGVIGGIFKARYSTAHHRETDGETQKLREDVRALRERIAVLERIATDRQHLLSDEIERLRDR